MITLEEKLLAIACEELQIASRYAGFSLIPKQLEQFQRDPVWSHFGFDNEEFLRLRNIGNYYTSIFRKIGDMYEKFVRAVVMYCLGLSENQIRYSFDIDIDGRLQTRSLDVSIDSNTITDTLLALTVRQEFARIAQELDPTSSQPFSSIGVMEVRSCYMIGDSKRIQADESAAVYARTARLLPILMVFCSTSLPSPLIRLRRSWYVVEGRKAYDLLQQLTGFDLYGFLAANRSTLRKEVGKVIEVFNLPR